MDRISLLPDDFLLPILTLLPTKDLITTSVLSKRWLNLWKLVSKLEFIDRDKTSDQGMFLQHVNRTLQLNTSPFLESLHFNLSRACSDADIGSWIGIGVERRLRELDFMYCHTIDEPCRFPQSLYTCGTLVVLKLKNVSFVDLQFPVCFQLLKTLHLDCVIFLDDESPKKLLACCPVLEVLELDRAENDNVTSFSVTVLSLQRFIYYSGSGSKLVLNTPSLKYFKTLDFGYKCKIEYMPEIVEASVEVICSNVDDILKSLASSVKSLLLCLPLEPRFPSGCMFKQLQDLEFCTCEIEWNLLMSLLQHAPKLRSLKLNEIHDHISEDGMFQWEEPSSIPETLTSVLETLEWRNYRGWKVEKEMATYILKHSRRLKTAIFSPPANTVVRTVKRTTLGMKYRMLIELARLPRGSTECELVFG